MTHKYTAQFLKARQGMPLELKVRMSQDRIRQFYEHFDGDVYISFSGGKDSTVLLDIVRSLYPHVPAVFVDTGLEYPEIKEFVRTIDNVIWLKPKMNFNQVLDKYGFPVISKMQAQYIDQFRNAKSQKTKDTRLHGNAWGIGKISNKWKFLIDAPFKISDRCCDVMKKRPVKKYEKDTGLKPFIGTMAGESNHRKMTYLRQGCNSFDSKRPLSKPMGFWMEEDIWDYIKQNNLSYSKIYDMGHKRTGCMFCMFGCHMESTPNRFQLMEKTHPKLHDYCVNKLGCGAVLDYINIPYSNEERHNENI
ncbi:MAG: phosphoadenosine phosphosulfate reductase family protein [Candidatus Heimdallarchaeota archaeon]